MLIRSIKTFLDFKRSKWLILFAFVGAAFVLWKKERVYYQVVERNARNNARDGRDISTNVACILPELHENDPVMMRFYKKMAPIDCDKEHKDLVYVENGTLRFSQPISSKTKCTMHPLIRGPGDYNTSFGAPMENVQNKTLLSSDFFKLTCSWKDKVIYKNIHLGVHLNTTLKERIQNRTPPADGLKLSVVMLGFDSMSRMSWLRRLPKTRDYFVNQLGAIELEGYAIMGDGTPAALFPMLTGKHEQELPEARRSFRGAQTVDDFPWIWKDFQRNGYVTSFSEASPFIATFNYRLLGFQHSPTDFYMRPFYLAAEKTYGRFTEGCHGAWRRHQVWFNFIKDIFKMYRHEPKFLYHFYDSISHDDNNRITMADEDLYQVLHFLESGGYLNNTLLVLFADHGARFSNVRSSLSGKLEERLPYMALRFPKWFHTRHPNLVQNIKANAKRLTTPMDIHETLKDILHFSGSGLGDTARRGISLFKEIPLGRTCAHADVAPHWCACMSWAKVFPYDDGVRSATQAAVDYINELTQDYRAYCVKLIIKRIVHAYRSEVSDSVLRFRATKGDRGLEPIMSESTRAEKVMYQLTFVTTPGNGEFEVTLEQDLMKNTFYLSKRSISRTNKYGNASDCIRDKTRELRPFCYCSK